MDSADANPDSSKIAIQPARCVDLDANSAQMPPPVTHAQ